VKVIIAGSRSFDNYKMLKALCDIILSRKDDIEVVSGGARGADLLGERYAKEKGYPIKRFNADWDNYGKAAGYKRNAEMAAYADGLIVFWDGVSKGSKHMIDLARKNKLKVRVMHFSHY